MTTIVVATKKMKILCRGPSQRNPTIRRIGRKENRKRKTGKEERRIEVNQTRSYMIHHLEKRGKRAQILRIIMMPKVRAQRKKLVHIKKQKRKEKSMRKKKKREKGKEGGKKKEREEKRKDEKKKILPILLMVGFR
jgi:hypothetical protein